jgi:IS30 family transposase
VGPQEEQALIRFWQAGASYAAIAQQLGIPTGAVGSCAHTLVRRGKNAGRPKGGAYPRSQVQSRHTPLRRLQCRDLVWELLLAYGFDAWGTCARIARELGCHRSTITRDCRAILRGMWGL